MPIRRRTVGERRRFNELENEYIPKQNRDLIDTTFPQKYMDRAVKGTTRVLTETGQRNVDRKAYGALTPEQRQKLEKFKRGGKVRRTGLALVHRGERVLTRRQNRKYMRRKRSRRK